MTSRHSDATDRYESAANAASSATARIADEGPYARPATATRQAVDAVLIDAIRASVGPFVPAPWRGASTTVTSAAASFMETVDESSEDLSGQDVSAPLPWIDTFLDAPDGSSEAVVDAVLEADVESVPQLGIDSVSEAATEAASTEIVAEQWPLEEAGAAMRALADDLGRNDVSGSASEVQPPDIAAPVASTPPLHMWNDDDMMDIMPVKAATAEGSEQWAARARRETERTGNPESAAQALEALARRVRSGEIQLPGFSPEMGEAAALATALAALLSVRR